MTPLLEYGEIYHLIPFFVQHDRSRVAVEAFQSVVRLIRAEVLVHHPHNFQLQNNETERLRTNNFF